MGVANVSAALKPSARELLQSLIRLERWARNCASKRNIYIREVLLGHLCGGDRQTRHDRSRVCVSNFPRAIAISRVAYVRPGFSFLLSSRPRTFDESETADCCGRMTNEERRVTSSPRIARGAISANDSLFASRAYARGLARRHAKDVGG